MRAHVEKEVDGSFYDTEYFLSLEYRIFSGAHGSRVKNIMKLIGDVNGKKVLDVGAGGGAFSCLMNERGGDVLAIDYSPFAVEFISSRFPVKAREFSVYDLETLNEGTFDLITLLDVIEHCDDQEKVLNNCCLLLKKGGKLIISTDVRENPYSVGFLRRLFVWFEKISREGIIYRGIKKAEEKRRVWKNYHTSHVGELSIFELRRLVEKCGMKVHSHAVYPLVGSPIRDFFLGFFPIKYRGDHQCVVMIK